MSIKMIDKETWVKMIQTGANYLSSQKEMINQLNVFPVPDGDTGTNMNLSMTSGVREMTKNINEPLQAVVAAFAKGMLMGARGNSGVILSQLFRGFSAGLQCVELEKDSVIGPKQFALALQSGVEHAYSSVTNPVEGTILTVAKDMAEVAMQLADAEEEITIFMEKIVSEATASLKRTPELLAILKEVGVVDSGGQGLLTIFEGFLAALKGDTSVSLNQVEFSIDHKKNVHDELVQSYIDIDSIQFGYCTEFFVRLANEQPFNEAHFREHLSEYGDSLLVAADDQIVKVHIHTEEPGNVLTYAQQFGSLMNIDIENMREQYMEIVAQNETDVPAEECKYAIITVAQGDGLTEMFKSIGATIVIDGGQTMNPSTEDFLQVIEKQQAEHIFILPNNKNIILAANQAIELSDKNITVIPSVTIPQGLKALFEFDEQLDADENKQLMNDALSEVKTGSITYATRDSNLNQIEIKKNDFIGMNDETIIVAKKSKIEALASLLQQMIDQEEDEIITIFLGADTSEAEKAAIEELMESTYDDFEYEIHNGNQPIYSIIFMIE